MKKFLFLMLTVIMMLPAVLRAQETLTVADGTETNSYVPIYGLYVDEYVRAQTIYPDVMLEDMIGASISSMTYYLSSSSTVSSTDAWGCPFRVRMAVVDDETFTSNAFNTTTLTEVYYGTITVETDRTMRIEFDEPFQYDGGHLMVDIINESTGTYKSSSYYGALSTGASIAGHNSSSTSGISSLTTYNFIPKTTFEYVAGGGPICKAVAGLSVTDVDEQSAVVYWSPKGDESSWDIYVAESEEDVPDATSAATYTSNDTNYTFSGLDASTTYVVYVRANCGDGVSLWKHVSFMTSQIPGMLPYLCDFEDEAENESWTIITGTPNSWYIGSAVNTTESGENALYVSNDNGTSNSYTNTTSCTSWAYRDIDFDQMAEYAIRFKYKVVGESGCDYLKVFVGAPATPSGSNTPAGATLLGTYYSQASWTDVELSLNSQHAGIQRVYFLWRNDGSAGSNPPAAVDDIEITGSNCGAPAALALGDIASDEITINITPALETDGAWEAQIVSGTDTLTESINETEYTFTGLNPDTYYQIRVRTDCGGEYSNWSNAVGARTACATVVAPYEETFVGFDSNPSACWGRYTGLASTIFNGGTLTSTTSGWYFNSSNVFPMGHPRINVYGSSSAKTWLVSPEIDLSNLNNPTLMFSLALTDYNNADPIEDPTNQADDKFMVIISTDGGATWTEENATIWSDDNTVGDYAYSTISSTGEDVAISLEQYAGETIKIAFYAESTVSNGDNDLHIYDVIVNEPVSCARPNALTVTEVTSSSVTLEWEEIGEASSWNVAYGPEGFTIDEETMIVNVSEPTATIYDLEGGTEYDFYVQSDCGGETSMWRGPITGVPGAYTFGHTGSDTVTACGLIIYDEGGITGTYDNNSDFVLVVYPEEEGSYVAVYGTIISEGVDYLRIYDGVGTSGSYTSYSGSSGVTIPTTVSTTGPLTLQFHSDVSITYAGFELHQTCVNCVAPAIQLENLTTESVTLTWSDNDGETSAWQLVYGPAGINLETAEPEDVFTNTYDLTDLTANTAYDVYIRANCGDEYSLWSPVTHFRTPCDAIDELPFEEGFDSYTASSSSMFNDCWTTYTTGSYYYPYVSSTYGYGGSSKSLYFGYSSDYYVALPQFEEELTALQLSFYQKYNTTSTYEYAVGVMSNPNDLSTFDTIYVGTVSPDWTLCEVPLASYTGTGRNLAIRTNKYMYIDNIVVDYLPECPTPTLFRADAISTNSISLSWFENGTAASWDITYFDGTDTITVTADVNEMFEISNLESSTAYTFTLVSDCGSNPTSLTVRTACEAFPIPFTEDFESYSTSTNIPCWTVLNGTVQTSTTYPCGGSQSLKFSGTLNNMVVMPAFTSEISELEISFNTRPESFTSNYSGTFQVGYVTNAADASTFVPTATFTWSDFTDCDERVALFPDAPAGSQIAFRHQPTLDNWFWFVDDINVHDIPTCPRPANFTLDSAESNSLFLSWTETGDATSWIISYFDGTDSVYETATTNEMYEISGLISNTAYTISLMADCGGETSMPIFGTFRTACGEISIPYTEDFESYATSADLPCWTVLGGTVQPSTSYTHSGSSRSLKFSGSTNNMIAMPSTEDEINTLELTFFTRPESFSTSSCGSFQVGYVTDLTDASSFVAVDNYTYSDFSNYEEKTVVFTSAPAGSYIAFRHQAGSSAWYWFIDDIDLHEAPSCPKPSQLSVTATTSTDVTLEWNENGSAPEWEIEYGPVGFTHGNGTTETATNHPYTVQGLTAGSYEFYVRANCDANDQSMWAGPVFAAPGSFNVPATGTVTVSMCGGTIYDDGGINGNYSTNCNATVVINPETPGMMVQITGTFDMEPHYDYIEVYDGTDATGTPIFVSSTDYDDPQAGTIPTTTSTTGSLTLHIVSDYSNQYSGFAISVECVNGSGPQPVDTCNAPTQLAASEITHSSVKLDWAQEGDVNSWTVYYKKATATSWSTIPATTHPMTITDLEAETAYEAYVKANCAEGESEASNTVTFTTNPDGVNDYVLGSSISLYPNPANEQLTISRAQGMMNEVVVYDVYGKTLRTMSVNDNTVVLNVNDLAAGMYFVRIITNEGMATKTFVKK